MFITKELDDKGNFDLKGNTYQTSLFEIQQLIAWFESMADKKDLRFEKDNV